MPSTPDQSPFYSHSQSQSGLRVPFSHPFLCWSFMLLFYQWLFSTSLCSLSRFPALLSAAYLNRWSQQVAIKPARKPESGIQIPLSAVRPPPTISPLRPLSIYAVFTFQSSQDVVVWIYDFIFLCVFFLGQPSQPHIISSQKRERTALMERTLAVLRVPW